MHPETEIEALLFDLGNVIVGVDFDRVFRSWSRDAGISLAEIKCAFTPDSAYRAHERGEIDAPEYFAALRNSLGIQLSDIQFKTGWDRIFTGEMPGMRKLLGRLTGEVPRYVLSNSNKLHQARWTREYAHILASFDSVFVSSEIGHRKPEPEAFTTVAAAIGIAPERIMFFDDALENTGAAKRIGMTAVHVQSTEDVERALSRCGLITPEAADQGIATKSR